MSEEGKRACVVLTIYSLSIAGEGLGGPFLRLTNVYSVPALSLDFQAWVWAGGREQVVSVALDRSCCVCCEMPGAWV